MGDDFIILGFEDSLNWLREAIQERYEIKFRGRLGPETSDDKSIRILNRVVWWDEAGVHYEAD